jgi:NAD(P)H-hydrate epimerase
MVQPASVPVLSCAEARRWEAGLLKNQELEWVAMQAAGGGLARALEQDFLEIGGLPVAPRLLVLAGKGHNGGDALLAAQVLLKGRPAATVDLLLNFPPTTLRPLAARALMELRQTGAARVRLVTLTELKAELASYEICLDGVFGFNFRCPLDEVSEELLAWVNTHPRIRLRAAVDLPSGLGEVNAATIFRADFTYATGIVKSAVLLPANAHWVGRVRLVDLGFLKEADVSPTQEDRVLRPAVLGALTQFRSPQSDKRTFGHLVVIGGSHGYPGAVLLAVRAALRSGVGLVTAIVPAFLVPEYAARYPEAMWVACPIDSAGGLAASTLPLVRARLARANAVLIGPGLGAEPATISWVVQLVQELKVPVVLDADALRPEVMAAAMPGALIATPHRGEFQRISGGLTLPEYCANQQAVVVLKGSRTQIGRPAFAYNQVSGSGSIIYHSLSGGPVLARGGSGDMLAGLIGGLLAQEPTDLLLAACRGVVWHGRAADLLARSHGQVAIEISQLLEQLGPALTPLHD